MAAKLLNWFALLSTTAFVLLYVGGMNLNAHALSFPLIALAIAQAFGKQ